MENETLLVVSFNDLNVGDYFYLSRYNELYTEKYEKLKIKQKVSKIKYIYIEEFGKKYTVNEQSPKYNLRSPHEKKCIKINKYENG